MGRIWQVTALISYSEALKLVETWSRQLPPASMPLGKSRNRFLATDVSANIASPRFDCAAVDGFALGAGVGPFQIVGEVAAGAQEPRILRENFAVRIFTGAPLPNGFSGVAMLEDCVVSEGHISTSGRVDHFRRRGEEFKEGESLARKGEQLTPTLMGHLASGGVDQINVARLPVVTVITTGDEVISLGKPLRHGQIINSNAVAIQAALAELGITPIIHHVKDDREDISFQIEAALECSDIIITCGGISVGDRDFLKELFQRAGVLEVFWRVSIKPGMPLYFGHHHERLVFGLPGNPPASIATFLMFVRPAILSLMGQQESFENSIHMSLSAKFAKKAARTEFVGGVLEFDKGRICIRPLPGKGLRLRSKDESADAIIILAEGIEHFEAGDMVEVVPIAGFTRKL